MQRLVCLPIIIISLGLAGELRAAPPAAYPEGNFTAQVKVTNHSRESHALAAKKARAAGKPAPVELKAPVMTAVEAVKFGEELLFTVTWSNAPGTSVWRNRATGLTVAQSPNGNISVTRGNNYHLPELLGFGPESIKWLNSASLVEPPKPKGKEPVEKLQHYRRTIEVEETTVVWQAWIDPDTRRPAAFDDGDCKYEITYGETAPEARPAPPPQLEKALERYRKARRTPAP